ncbi:hypothetical protein [Kitasatospora sp. NPDC090091]|uniref:P-loop NTPase n=1 Tax=Kitasatospora sp. NPDC090091 TaxID=3364081 RepID=UPI0037F488BD
MTGVGGLGSGYAVGGRLVLSSAHVTGPVGTRVQVFHPGGSGTADATVVWSGTPGEQDDAALVLVDDSPHWRPPSAAVRWGRLVTDRPGVQCEAWGVPAVAQRPRQMVEVMQLAGWINPGTGFVDNQYVMDFAAVPVPRWAPEGFSPWAGLSGATVHCDRVITGVVARSDHDRLHIVPAYVLHYDPAFRAALAEHDGGAVNGLEAVEFQDLADPAHDPVRRRGISNPEALLEARRQIVSFRGREDLLAELLAWCHADGFHAQLIEGPGGQGKTRLAHQLSHWLDTAYWTALWPRAEATPEELLQVRHAIRPLLIILDHAETRTRQLTAIVEAVADRRHTSPLKLLLLARRAGDWWHRAQTSIRLADHLGTARTHYLTPLEDDPSRRADHYREAAYAFAAALPLVDGMENHDWTAAAAALPPPHGLDRDVYGNVRTLHMSALANLLDSTRLGSNHAAPAAIGSETGAHRTVPPTKDLYGLFD